MKTCSRKLKRRIKAKRSSILGKFHRCLQHIRERMDSEWEVWMRLNLKLIFLLRWFLWINLFHSTFKISLKANEKATILSLLEFMMASLLPLFYLLSSKQFQKSKLQTLKIQSQLVQKDLHLFLRFDHWLSLISVLTLLR